MISEVVSGQILKSETCDLEFQENRSKWLSISYDNETRKDINVAMLVAFIIAPSADSPTISVKFAGCLTKIKNANRNELARANDFMQRIISNSIQGLEIPDEVK